MAVNVKHAGVSKARSKQWGFIYYFKPGFDYTTLDWDTDLSTVAEVFDVGSASVDTAPTLSPNTKEGDKLYDLYGNLVEQGDPEESNTFKFAVNEISQLKAARLVFKESSITTDGNGNLVKIEGNEKADNVGFILDTVVGDTFYRIIMHECSNSGKGDEVFGDQKKIFSWESNWTVLDVNGGFTRLFKPRTTTVTP